MQNGETTLSLTYIGKSCSSCKFIMSQILQIYNVPNISINTIRNDKILKKNLLIYSIQIHVINEPRHEISNNVVCATSKASDQPAHTGSLIRALASCLNIL